MLDTGVEVEALGCLAAGLRYGHTIAAEAMAVTGVTTAG